MPGARRRFARRCASRPAVSRRVASGRHALRCDPPGLQRRGAETRVAFDALAPIWRRSHSEEPRAALQLLVQLRGSRWSFSANTCFCYWRARAADFPCNGTTCNRLPSLPVRGEDMELPVHHHAVVDTIEGWADASAPGSCAVITKGFKAEFNFSAVRRARQRRSSPPAARPRGICRSSRPSFLSRKCWPAQLVGNFAPHRSLRHLYARGALGAQRRHPALGDDLSVLARRR